MKKNTLVLAGITASLLIIGAGCTAKDSGDQTGYDYNTPPSTAAVSSAADITNSTSSAMVNY